VLWYKSTSARESVVLTACVRDDVDIIVEHRIKHRARIFVFIVVYFLMRLLKIEQFKQGIATESNKRL